MKAVVCTGYGPPDVLQLRELDLPVPKHDEVRIRIHATAVTSSDCIVRSFNLPASMWLPARLVLGITKPRQPVLGMVLAGEIDTAGNDVTALKAGDRVFGLDRFDFGAYAEYKCMPESGVLASKPSNLSYEEAAAIPYGGLLALHFLRRGQIRRGHRVLVYGASGAVRTCGWRGRRRVITHHTRRTYDGFRMRLSSGQIDTKEKRPFRESAYDAGGRGLRRCYTNECQPVPRIRSRPSRIRSRPNSNSSP